jgi:hypothetical protein
MKLHLAFKESDFSNLRSFEKAIQKQLGTNVYVGTDSLCVFVEYPKELKDMLRPYPQKVQLEFDLGS